MARLTPATTAPPRSLVRALRKVLRPLVRLMLAHQITYPFLANLLKTVFVELAERELAIPDKAQTISRLSLLTGIHRKDVKRLREEPFEDDAPPPVVSLGAQLVARWTAVEEFLDDNDRPRPLARVPGSAHQPGFDELVASVSKDIRSRAVLDEWLRLGIAHIDADDCVRLKTEAFVPESGFDEKAHYFGRNLHDHIATSAHNLIGAGPSMLERSVYYDELTPASVDELSQLAEEKGMEALQAVNRRALALQNRDAGDKAARERMNFGLYFHRAEVSDAADDGGSSDA